MQIKPEPGRAKTKFEPDYISFLVYAFLVLNYIEQRHPEAEKVDFLVERNGKVTKYIQEFHSHLALNLEALGKGRLARLVGNMIPAGKDRVPLQAADVLCWYAARSRKPETMDSADIHRYLKLLRHRKGVNHKVPKKQISKILASLSRRAKNSTINSQ